MANIIGWFEIPVTDIDRAVKFYCRVFGYETLQRMNFGGFEMAFFPMNGEDVSGALCKGEHYVPTQEGVLIYFSAEPDLIEALERVEPAGGKVVMPKKIISEEYGYMALFLDSEGNRIAIHSSK